MLRLENVMELNYRAETTKYGRVYILADVRPQHNGKTVFVVEQAGA